MTFFSRLFLLSCRVLVASLSLSWVLTEEGNHHALAYPIEIGIALSARRQSTNLKKWKHFMEMCFNTLSFGSKLPMCSGDLKSGLVWILNGQKEVGLQNVYILNGPIFEWLGL